MPPEHDTRPPRGLSAGAAAALVLGSSAAVLVVEPVDAPVLTDDFAPVDQLLTPYGR